MGPVNIVISAGGDDDAATTTCLLAGTIGGPGDERVDQLGLVTEGRD